MSWHLMPSFVIWSSWAKRRNKSRNLCEITIPKCLGVEWPASAMSLPVRISVWKLDTIWQIVRESIPAPGVQLAVVAEQEL